MKALAILVLVFGPVMSVPAAVGLWAWRFFSGKPHALDYALGAGAAAGVAMLALLSRRGLVREAAMLAATLFWTCWLWFALTDARYDWTGVPALHVPGSMERIPMLAIALAYLTFYVVAEHRPARAG